MKIGECGAGKVGQGSDGVKFHMESDKTLIEVSMSADEDESVGRWKSNTFYMLCKELSKEPHVAFDNDWLQD